MTNVDGKAYPSYRDSGQAWLGRVPEHWDVLPARAAFSEVKERDRPEEQMLSVTIARGVIRQDALLADTSKKDSSNLDRSAYKFVRPGDIAYNKMRAWQGAIGVSDHEGIVSPAYVVQRLRVPGVPRYFHYLLRTPAFAKEAERWSYGITSDMWSLRPEHFRTIYMCFPPQSEQGSIVEFLDSLSRRIGRFIRTKQQLIKLLEEQKLRLVRQALTRGVSSGVKLKDSGVSWLGRIPEHWEIRRAKAVCSRIIDCKNRTPDAVIDGEYLVVRTTCIRDGEFREDGGYGTDLSNFKTWTMRGAPQGGDVFFTREAPAGEACLVPDRGDLCMGQRMMYFRPDPELLDPRFLLMNIYGPLTKTYIELATNGSTVGHLRLGQVYSLPLIWCPVEEQRAIVEYLDEKSAEIEAAQRRARSEIELVLEYRTRLIADVVTGKLDVREAAAALPEELDEAEDLTLDNTLAGDDEAELAEDDATDEEVVA